MNRNTKRRSASRRSSSRSSSGISRGQFIRRAGIGAAGVGAAMMGIGGLSGVVSAGLPQPGGTLATVLARGKVKVAVSDSDIEGFIKRHPDGRTTGIEADFARALAGAIFGSGNVDSKVEFVPANSTSRFEKLASGEVDVVFRVCTARYDRDVNLQIGSAPRQGYTFAPTYYYDGANIILWNDAGTGPYNVAIGAGTSTIDAIRAVGDSNINIIETANSTEAQAAWIAGTYNGTPIHGYATDTSGLVGLRLTYPATYFYFNGPVSKEPLSPVTREGDDNWSDILRWVMFALFTAEEQGVTMTSVNNKWGSTLADIGLKKSWPSECIRSAGNYKEIYDRNLVTPYLPLPSPFGARAKNELWTNGGLLYAWPGIK